VPSIVVDARAVVRHHGPRTVLQDVGVRVHSTSRIALIGPNGSGKSTLLRVLAGLERPDGGTVRRHGAVGHLPQLADHADPRPALAVALERLGVAEAGAAVDAEAARLGTGDLDAIGPHAAALERWLALGGDDAEARLTAAAEEVGLSATLLGRPLSTLSGGQAARVGLATLRASRHDAVLLDEPTNHLDADGLAVLRRVLAEHRGGIVVVSHDRALLADVADELVVLGDPDAPAGTAVRHAGDFASWERRRSEERARARAAHEDAAGARAALREAARETRRRAEGSRRRAAGATHDNDKHAKEWVRSRAEGMQRRARIVEGRAERPLPEKPREPARLRLALTAAERRAPWVVALEGAVLKRGTWALGPVDLEVAHGERVLLTGPNGSGKSTLIGAIAGRQGLAEGVRHAAPGAVVAELGQDRARLLGADAATVATLVAAAAAVPDAEARTALASFGVPAEVVARSPATLSPGERTRAELALLALRRTTCLLLDEPTNHLDLPSLQALEAALAEWPGALVVASHDTRFVAALGPTRRVQLPLAG
jgi:ATPase subunit of ABC transporter with duplicated ATPase domains